MKSRLVDWTVTLAGRPIVVKATFRRPAIIKAYQIHRGLKYPDGLLPPTRLEVRATRGAQKCTGD